MKETRDGIFLALHTISEISLSHHHHYHHHCLLAFSRNRLYLFPFFTPLGYLLPLTATSLPLSLLMPVRTLAMLAPSHLSQHNQTDNGHMRWETKARVDAHRRTQVMVLGSQPSLPSPGSELPTLAHMHQHRRQPGSGNTDRRRRREDFR